MIIDIVIIIDISFQQETVNETSDNEVDNIELNNLSGLVERKPRMTSDSAINRFVTLANHTRFGSKYNF